MHRPHLNHHAQVYTDMVNTPAHVGAAIGTLIAGPIGGFIGGVLGFAAGAALVHGSIKAEHEMNHPHLHRSRH